MCRDAPLMPTARDRRITLTFTDAVTVLMDACGIPPAGRKAFEARVRHLQRLGLPARTSDQKMSRIDYGIAELAAFATAFRLMAAFLIPVLAVRYVTERWDQLAPFALAGAREALPADYLIRRRVEACAIAIFEGNALADLGQKGRLDERYVGPLGRIVVADPASADLAAMTGGAALLIDSRTYMPLIVERVADLALATDADLMGELDRLRPAS